jgi:hypothetical protein
MGRKIFFTIPAFTFIILSCLRCEKDSPVGPVEEGYPSTYLKINNTSLDRLTSEYRAANHPGLYTLLDTFGFISTNVQLDDGFNKYNFGTVTESFARNIAKRFIQANSKFTGVADTSLLKFSRIKGLQKYQRPDFCNWNIVFENQIEENLEVENTSIYLHLDSLGVYRAGGHWYPEIIIPEYDNLNYEMAKKQISGLKLTTYGWSGPIEHTINATTTWRDEEVKKVIYPLVFQDRIEIYVVWQLFPSIWRVLVDTTTGEVIHTEPTVIF